MNAPTCPLCQGAMVRDHHGVGFIGAGFAWLVLALGLLMSICLFPIGALAGIVGLLVAMLIFQTRRDVLTCDGCGYTVDRIGGGRRTGPMGGRSLSERLITEPQAPAAPDFTRKQIVCGVIIFVCFIGALGGVSVFQRQREQAAAAAGEPPAQARGDPKAPPGTPGYAYRNLDAVVYAFLEATGENKPAKPSRLQIPVSELRAWQAALGRWMTSSDAVRMRNGELHIGDPWWFALASWGTPDHRSEYGNEDRLWMWGDPQQPGRNATVGEKVVRFRIDPENDKRHWSHAEGGDDPSTTTNTR